MTERHRVRVVLECEVEVRDITMAAVRARHKQWHDGQLARGWCPEAMPEEPSQQQLDDLRLLQEKLRATPASMKEWILFEVGQELGLLGLEKAYPPPGEEERILTPVIESLPPAQRHRFREAVHRDGFWEMAEEFYLSFNVAIRSVSMTQPPSLRLLP